MSRKTSEIKKSIENMMVLQKQLSEISKNQDDQIARKNQILLNELEVELKNLSVWFEMIYRYNGKSKSNAKAAASRENGKKGGRPPKAVTDLKKKISVLQTELEEIHNKRLAVFDFEKEQQLSDEETKLNAQIEELSEKLEELK